jgi:hypothetical protein
MLEFRRKTGAQPATDIRDVLFGDLPLAEWPPASGMPHNDEPWASFVKARELLEKGDHEGAARILSALTATPKLESRHYLEAWHALRQLGASPPSSEQKRLLGIVVEVGMEKGLDIVAAYEDRSARYINFSGAAVIWDRPDESLDTPVNILLDAGKVVTLKIGPWLDRRPAAPRDGDVRINMLTPGGLHFGQGPFAALAGDPLAAPVIVAATELMKRLIEKSGQPRPPA